LKKGWLWVALALLLAVVIAAWLGRRALPQTQPAAAAPVPALVIVAEPAARASAPSLVDRRSAAAAPEPDTPKVDVSKEFIDVCGVGRVRRSELERRDSQPAPAWAQALEQQSELGLAEVLKRLDAGSVKQRVAAAVLRGDVQAAAQLAASANDAGTYRLGLRACRKDAAYRAAHASANQQRDPLAASASSGLQMPEMAAPGTVPHACAALNFERLELLDPDDAWPSLARLSDAQQQGDEVGVSQALYQIAQRRRLAVNARALSATLADVVGAEPTPGEAWALVMAVGTDMASTLDASLSNVGRSCRPQALRDANRRQLCEQVTRRMPELVAEAMDSRVLHALEERMGLPHSPQALSREQFEQGIAALSEDSMRWMAEPTCANVSDMGRQLVLQSRQGELAWMRANMKAKPTPASVPR